MMNYPEKLLDGQKVEWKALGEVLVRTKGTPITAGKMKELHKENAPIKIFAGGKTFAYVDFDDIPQKDINRQPSIIVKSRGVIEFEYYDKPFSHKNEMWSYHSNDRDVEIKFIYYFLKQNEHYFQKIASKMQMPQIAIPDTDKFLVPIPPLSLQKEIVKILDKMTELEAELALRVKQYRYYRDLLLDYENPKNPFSGSLKKVEWKPLGEIGDVRMCKRILKNQTTRFGDVPFYKIGTFGKKADAYISKELFTEYKSKYHYPQKGSVLISASGTIGRTIIFDGEQAYFQDSNIVWLDNDESKILNKFLFYFYQVVNWNITEGGTIQRLYIDNLKKIKIPIPPLETQAKIVEILDKFDTLTQSITDGLPKEIALRRQQYEYYRGQLLDFPIPDDLEMSV